MNPENLPKTEEQPYDPNLEAQDEDLTSGGNNRLTYILVGVILALVVGYVALPKGHGSVLSSVTPSFMLDDAAVTATAPTAADSAAAGLTAAAAAGPEGANAEAARTNPKTTARPASAAASVAAAPAATTAPAAAPAAPEAAPDAAATPAPAPAAPASITMTGKIDDENGKPLAGATVFLKGSSKGTSTDANGNYTMEVPAGADNTLVYGYGGYEDEEIHSRGNQPVNITLTPRAKAKKRR